MTSPSAVYLGLGSNLGDRQSNLAEALQSLRAHVRIERISPVYETEPVHVTDQPRFLNGAVALETELGPRELLERLLRIERELGRERGEGPRFGPRPIDLDLLLYGEEVVDEPGLNVPHPRLAERRFALEPLHELDPDLRLPDGRRVQELLAAQLE